MLTVAVVVATPLFLAFLSPLVLLNTVIALQQFLVLSDQFVEIKATGNSRSGIPGNSRESRTPKFPAGIPGNLLNSGGNYGEFIGVLSFSYFYC